MPQPKALPRSFYWIAAVFIIVLLLNAFVWPLLQQPVTEIDYAAFLTMLEKGAITKIELTESQINITASDESGAEKKYVTGYIYDPNLVTRLTESQVNFGAPLPQQNSFLMELLFSWILPLAFFIAVGQLMIRSLTRRMGTGEAMSFGRSNAKIYIEAKGGKTFLDVAGQEEGKRSLLEIVDFLHNPGRYAAIGASIPKGVLLVGPPGTGKTLLAQATAGEAGVPFFSISGSDFVEMFAGMGAARVRDLFKQAQEKAPCIVFIDEIDTIGKRRDVGGFIGGNDEREQTLNQLLSEMDGFDGSKGVVLIGATNRPEILDQALLRAGRFDRRVPVELPDLAGRNAILKVHLRKVQVEKEIDVNAIARATPGASGADLANIVNEAALLAVRNNHSKVTHSDLEEAVETVIAGEQRKSAVISPKERKIIAVHEMGHALVGALSDSSTPVRKITIVPRTSGALGYTMQVPEDESVLMSKEEALTRIRTLIGGRAAEEIVFNSVTSGASNDIEQATRLARSMVTRLGMSDSFDMMHLETSGGRYLVSDGNSLCAPETAAQVDQEVLSILRSCHQEATDLLRQNLYRLETLAAKLLEVETLGGDEFHRLLEELPAGEAIDENAVVPEALIAPEEN